MKAALVIVFLAVISVVPLSLSETTTTAHSTDATTSLNQTTTQAPSTTTGLSTSTNASTTPNDTTTAGSTTANGTTTMAPTTKPTTTTAPTPTPSTKGTWAIKGADNQTCMKMSFEGSVKMNNNEDIIAIPSVADPVGSTCNGDASDFQLVFEDPTAIQYTIILRFVLQDKATSYLWNATVNTNETRASQVQVRFETPVGQSFQCDEQTIPVGKNFNLTLSNMRIQPFASYAGHDFGDIYSCVAPKKQNAAVVVGLVLGAIILILLVALIVLCRKKKGPGRGYNNFS